VFGESIRFLFSAITILRTFVPHSMVLNLMCRVVRDIVEWCTKRLVSSKNELKYSVPGQFIKTKKIPRTHNVLGIYAIILSSTKIPVFRKKCFLSNVFRRQIFFGPNTVLKLRFFFFKS